MSKRIVSRVLCWALWGLFSALLVDCATVGKVTPGITELGQAAGVLTHEQAASINKSAVAVGKTFESITPEQEYYIGRAVSATILTSYKPYTDEQATHYVNVLGQTLAMASDRPETFGGYHFMLIDADEVNAFSAPGGLVMISRGMVRCCKTEDALAAVLAHEIGHVAHRHGLQAIQKGRITSALTILAVESGKNLGGQELAQLTKEFEGSITDITSTLVNKGYSRALESDADKAALMIMQRVGYNPQALVDMLEEMKKGWSPGGLGFAKTHPDPADRIMDVQTLIGASHPVSVPDARQKRFENVLGTI